MGIGDSLGLVGCALGFRVPLPYRQHQHKHRGQVLTCFPFSDLYASLTTFWKHSSLKKTCRTNENMDSVDLNL